MTEGDVARLERALDNILKEVQAINSRVRKVELWKAKMEGAGMALKGVWLVSSAAIGAVLGITAAAITLAVGG